MSDPHNEHASPIRTPKQLIGAVIGFFAVVIIGIVLLVQYVTTDRLTGRGSNSQAPEEIAARLSPVANEGFTMHSSTGPKVLQSGEAVYTATCAACHGAGVAGAPKFGDAAAWAPRIAQGYDTLVKHALEGLRAMPAKGGNPALDDIEVARAMVHMANQAGAKFKEPEAPAPAADAAAPAAAAATPAPAPAK